MKDKFNKYMKKKKNNNRLELGKINGQKIMIGKPKGIYEKIMTQTDFSEE